MAFLLPQKIEEGTIVYVKDSLGISNYTYGLFAAYGRDETGC